MDAQPQESPGKGDHLEHWSSESLDAVNDATISGNDTNISPHSPNPQNTLEHHTLPSGTYAPHDESADTNIDDGNTGQGTLTPTADHPYGKRSLLRTTERAILRRWPITAEKRQAVVREAFALLTGSASENTRLRAASVLLACERADNARIIAAQQKPPQVNVNLDISTKEAQVFGVIDNMAFATAARRLAGEQNCSAEIVAELPQPVVVNKVTDEPVSR